MRLILNIGLDVNGTRAISEHVALEMVKANGFIVHKHATHESDTEATLVALVQTSPIDFAHAGPKEIRAALHCIAKDLQQDCIAVHVPLVGDGLVGAVVGPKPWGAFDPSLFLQLNGTRLAPAKATA